MHESDAEIQALLPRDKPYKHFLGNGLHVLVRPPDGKKYWRLKYRFEGREQCYSIGVFPNLSVAMAIEKTHYIRNLLSEGINPMEAKRQAAKLRDDFNCKTIFGLEMSLESALTIETNTKIVTLTPGQTKALYSFLSAHHESKRG